MFADLVKKARSIRRFDEQDPIPPDTLRELVDIARLVPSAGNHQPLRYCLISSTEDRQRLFPSLAWAGALKDWDGPGPGERPTGYILILSRREAGPDLGIAAQTIQLAAVSLGYGACMLGAIKRDQIKKDLSLPAHLHLNLVIALGRPAETVVLEPLPEDGSTNYWRSADGGHHVPKRSLEDVLLP